MTRMKHLLLTSSLFVLTSLATAPCASAEHIFAGLDINGVEVLSNSEAAAQSLASFAPAQANSTTVIDANGNFVFRLTLFNTDRFGDGAVVNITFAPTAGSTLPPPPNQTFNYNGTGTPDNPVIFSFTQPYRTPGVFDGTVTLELLSFASAQGPAEREVLSTRITLVAGSPVPEPATLLLFATGLAGVAAGVGRRRCKP